MTVPSSSSATGEPGSVPHHIPPSLSRRGLLPISTALSLLSSSLSDSSSSSTPLPPFPSYRATSLSGGLTNDNILLEPNPSSFPPTSSLATTPPPHRTLVLRRFDLPTTSALRISRSSEVRNSHTAHQKGVAPRVVLSIGASHKDGEGSGMASEHGGGMVVSFLRGLTLDNERLGKLCEDEMGLGLLCGTLRKLHGRGGRRDGEMQFENEWDPRRMREGYVEWCEKRGVNLPDQYEHLVSSPTVTQIYSVLLDEHPEELVDAHNDLLAANLILTASSLDGNQALDDRISSKDQDSRSDLLLLSLLASEGAEIKLIDFELSGRAPPSWDLGAMASECQLSDDIMGRLLDVYWASSSLATVSFDGGRNEAERRALMEGKKARTKLWSILAKLTWVPWAFVVGRAKAEALGSGADGTKGEAEEEEEDRGESFDYQAWALERLDMASRALQKTDDIQALIDAVKREPETRRGEDD